MQLSHFFTATKTCPSDNDAIFRAAAADAGKVVLTKLSWYAPHVLPNDREKHELYK